jgi:hypothetical protein
MMSTNPSVQVAFRCLCARMLLGHLSHHAFMNGDAESTNMALLQRVDR